MSSAETACEEKYLTKTGIPIRNLWYMLLYVWDAANKLERWRSEVESAPSLDALLASILTGQVRQRLRVGLGRDYRGKAGEVCGIRGRIDFAESIRRMSLPHGRAFCRYQTFSANVLKNRVIRSTLARLAQVGDFGTDKTKAGLLRKKLRGLVREMEGIEDIELKQDIILRERLKQQDADYIFMLSICHLIVLRLMPSESVGRHLLPKIDRDTLTLSNIYEKFVAAFYKHYLTDCKWQVKSQGTIRWPVDGDSKYLPVMKPDLMLTHSESGRLIILDTKFSKSSIVTGQWGNVTFNRDHLFQIYAYLRSQEGSSENHKTSVGVLLYPAVGSRLREKANIQGHDIHWITIDLAQPWKEIERELLSIPGGALKPG